MSALTGAQQRINCSPRQHPFMRPPQIHAHIVRSCSSATSSGRRSTDADAPMTGGRAGAALDHTKGDGVGKPWARVACNYKGARGRLAIRARVVHTPRASASAAGGTTAPQDFELG